MATNDFRLTSIFKIIVRICMKNVDLDEKALNQQLCLMKYVYNEISNSTSHKKNKTKQNKKKNKAIIQLKTFLKLLKNFYWTSY